MKKNCWKVKKCGRETDGSMVNKFKICRAATAIKFNNVNGGKNAGRACWMVAGTLCGDKIEGSYAKKGENCILCNFYKLVKKEEGYNFKMLLIN